MKLYLDVCRQRDVEDHEECRALIMQGVVLLCMISQNLHLR